MSSPKSKFWCFTENANASTFRNTLESIWDVLKDGGVNYICGQLEQGEHLHFQGYLQLKASRALSTVRNLVSNTAHWEIQRGTNLEAQHYTKKPVDECSCKHCIEERAHPTAVPDTWLEFGTFSAGYMGAGARNDIHNLREAVKSGMSQREIIENDGLVETFAEHMRFHDRCRSLYAPKRKRDNWKVSLYYGEPRSGKTLKAMTENPDLFEIPISNGTMWLDGYDGHEVVLFDDFAGRASKLTLDNTLKFFDRYVRKVPVKGTHAWYMPEHIIVTTNLHPRAWFSWTNREEHWEALRMRFTEVLVFHRGEEPESMNVEEFMLDHDLWPQYDVNGIVDQ